MEELITLEKRVRSPIVDGLFYPEAEADVLAFMQSMGLKRGKGGLARAIIAPHGAWEVSGSLAGAAFASAGGRNGSRSPSRVVLLGPIHDKKEGLFLTHSCSFQTSLGDIPVDQEASGWIEAYSPFFEVNDAPHLHEHSIEILLPFVKYYFPDASIIPILMGCPREQYISVLASALRAVFEPVMKDTLLVVSFNMAIHSSEEDAHAMADEYVRLFNEGKYCELSAALKNGRITSCGGALVAALLQSGLVDTARPRLASDSLLSVQNDQNQTAYYGAFSFE
ncbi:MAG: AmmeMemoRadiSam system protein B [Treponema sp.]|nr:AmmeMemoRadiSam system protein B [Treponema sp.]